MSETKKRHRRSKVQPMKEYKNYAYDQESLESDLKNNKKTELWRNATDKTNAINVISNVKASAAKWRSYTTSKRKGGIEQAGGRRKTGGDGLDDIADEHFIPKDPKDTKWQMKAACNRNLIQYFAKLGQSKNQNEKIDLAFVSNLLENGALIDCSDKYGQTVFHEVARAWHIDVARFLLEKGADINKADNFGRTALHVAAAVDYPEMVKFLIQSGADKEALTLGESQTAVHFAARNDACNSLRELIKLGCEYKLVRDYKGRTPLHLAAELDRSETARQLLELDDPAPAGVEDHSGQAAIVWMITKMGPVAKEALNQFHTTDRANRKQYYHLHRLEPRKPGIKIDGHPATAMQVLVSLKMFDLITHNCVQRLIDVKWNAFGKLGAWISLLVNMAFIIVWTAIACTVEYSERHIYTLPQDWWRILLGAVAVGLTLYNIGDEILEFRSSRKSHNAWKEWRENEIDRDRKYSHPRWPEEDLFLIQEKRDLDDAKPQYFNDFWNVFDWICYFMLSVCVGTHIGDVFFHTDFLARLHIRIMAVTIILIWLRLMKNARAFATLGPFIVMLGHMVGDIVKFGFLYLEFFIPFACAFWMIFGGKKLPQSIAGTPAAVNATLIEVNGYGDWNQLLFSMFRLTLVDEYDYAGMKLVDSIMADILVGLWLSLSAILCLNLFIALLSDTFQRVYDNAQANAVMQKAITILSLEGGMSFKRREKFRKHIHTNCAPEEKFYDDDTTTEGGDDLKKVTLQIKDDLDQLRERLDDRATDHDNNTHNRRGGDNTRRPPGDNFDDDDDFGPNVKPSDAINVRKFEDEIDILWKEIRNVREKQEDILDQLKSSMSTIHSMLKHIQNTQTDGDSPRRNIAVGESHIYANDAGKTLDMANWATVEKKKKKDQKKLKRRQEKLNMMLEQSHLTGDDVPLIQTSDPTIEVSTSYSEPAEPPAIHAPSEFYPGANEAENMNVFAETMTEGGRPDVRIMPTVLSMEGMSASEA
ncbi:unnamed protein product [Owenia fusiformis]|uniref:Uncharacterized protein n=1 Tax=Owenia fusiformis TaxID=6347 RepID=A0A8J1Y9T8_OWEFU|nr:unnamed protein product [Owenia fusiformis]